MQGDDKNLIDTEKEDRRDKGVHSFWRRGTAFIFDVLITDSDVARNRGAPTEKILEMNEKEKKNKYQEKCWKIRRDFTPFFYMVYGMTGRDARASEKRLVKLLAEKQQREYLDMVGFVQAAISQAVVRSNTLLLNVQHGNRGLMGRKYGAGVGLESVWRT